ncbi:MAG: DUF2834 domain-containing protein [Roseibium sp.]
MKTFYLIAAILGTIVPWIFFAGFVSANGTDFSQFIQLLFANGPSSGLTADLLIATGIFWVWSWRDAKENRVAGWWLTIPAIWLVGLSLGLPLYLWLRERVREAGPAAPPAE